MVSFPVLKSSIALASETYQTNRRVALERLEAIDEALAKAAAGGGEKYNTRHMKKGKLLPRDRIALLLDRGSPFLEIAPLAGHGVRGEPSGTSVVGGIGLVSGALAVITASEATVKGGAVTPLSLAKSDRFSTIAEENRLPSISLIESAGADLPNQDRIFIPGGAGFRSLTRRSAARIPSICLVFGSSTAGGAYLPGMSDYAVLVKEQAQVYLAGPPLVKMATGEESDHESLGGAEMHSSVSGVSDYLAEDERDAIRLGRQIMAHLGYARALQDLGDVEPPRYDEDELLGIASADFRTPFDPREVIARVVDGSRFSEFKPRYGSTLVCGWSQLGGRTIGIVANHGTLFSESANKGAQFIALCNQRSIPLLFLQNTTGFMVGKEYEQRGIIKNGAKLINAVSNSAVPAITLMIGSSFGAGNYAMLGRAYAPRFLFSWPNHRIAVMGGKQLAGVLDILQRQSAARRGTEVDEQKLAVMKAMTEQTIDKQSTALYATARLWDDGILDPRDTRAALILALSAALHHPTEGSMAFGVHRH
ncbi:MAG: carboxyl transferase domain-containing protein [Myxococcota bacterium]